MRTFTGHSAIHAPHPKHRSSRTMNSLLGSRPMTCGRNGNSRTLRTPMVLGMRYLLQKRMNVRTPPHFHWRYVHSQSEYEEREERNRIRRKPVVIEREKLINIVVKKNRKNSIGCKKYAPVETEGCLPTPSSKMTSTRNHGLLFCRANINIS